MCKCKSKQHEILGQTQLGPGLLGKPRPGAEDRLACQHTAPSQQPRCSGEPGVHLRGLGQGPADPWVSAEVRAEGASPALHFPLVWSCSIYNSPLQPDTPRPGRLPHKCQGELPGVLDLHESPIKGPTSN